MVARETIHFRFLNTQRGLNSCWSCNRLVHAEIIIMQKKTNKQTNKKKQAVLFSTSNYNYWTKDKQTFLSTGNYKIQCTKDTQLLHTAPGWVVGWSDKQWCRYRKEDSWLAHCHSSNWRSLPSENSVPAHFECASIGSTYSVFFTELNSANLCRNTEQTRLFFLKGNGNQYHLTIASHLMRTWTNIYQHTFWLIHKTPLHVFYNQIKLKS
jgi:hypothetical protein